MADVTVQYRGAPVDLSGIYEPAEIEVGFPRGYFDVQRATIGGVDVMRMFEDLRDLHGHSVLDRLAQLAVDQLDRNPAALRSDVAAEVA